MFETTEITTTEKINRIGTTNKTDTISTTKVNNTIGIGKKTFASIFQAGLIVKTPDVNCVSVL